MFGFFYGFMHSVKRSESFLPLRTWVRSEVFENRASRRQMNFSDIFVSHQRLFAFTFKGGGGSYKFLKSR